MALLECVPNVSEGRCAAIIDALATAVEGEGARLLDVSSDATHHRSVMTLADEPGGLIGAIEALCARACELLDLRRHSGVHPRLGVIDVVPFTALRDAGMVDAVAAARECGERVGSLGLPTYLYGEAATREAIRLPAALRRLGLEELSRRCTEEDWCPDFGPAQIDPARGVVLVGARGFLVAFNLFLETSDVRTAAAIARRVRASAGGLPGVQALGFSHPRGAQVSTNLLEPETTSMGIVALTVDQIARDHGTRVVDCEIVGLVPRSAARRAVADGLDPALVAGRVLEDRIA